MSYSHSTARPSTVVNSARLSRWSVAGVGALLLVGLTGCGSDPVPQPRTGAVSDLATDDAAGGADDAAEAKPVSEEDDGRNSAVNVDERIRKLCDLPEARFDFDSAAVSASAKDMLDKLAECFIGGPARGESMRIVGHADNRGETEYNFALGQRRAGAIAGYLLRAGLAEERVATSSRGEMDATGTDATGYAKDRRVEIVLAE